MLGRFFVTPEALEFLRRGIGIALGDDLPAGDRDLLDSVIGYLEAVTLHSPFAAAIERTPVWRTCCDLESWRDDDYSRPLDVHRHDGWVERPTRIPPEVRQLIRNRIETFGDHPSGLGKFTRTLFARDLRRELAPVTALGVHQPHLGPVVAPLRVGDRAAEYRQQDFHAASLTASLGPRRAGARRSARRPSPPRPSRWC